MSKTTVDAEIVSRHEEAAESSLTESTYNLLIGGEACEAQSGKSLDAVDPTTGNTLATVEQAGPSDVDKAVSVAREAFEGEWKDRSPQKRSRTLETIADELEERQQPLATIESLDVGKPVPQAYTDISMSADYLRYYSSVTRTHEEKKIPLGSKKLNYTQHEPYGVVGQITPWNFPLLSMTWKTAPALAAGNTVVLKPPERAPLSSLEFGKVMAGHLPDGALNVVPGVGKETGEHLTQHSGIDKISFTGSTATGQRVMSNASSNITPVTLELGGKSPNIIFSDADLEDAVTGAMMGIFLNQGEMCTAGSRIFVHKDVEDEFIGELTRRTEEDLNLGDPLTKGVNIGPLIDHTHCDRVLEYIESARQDGATIITGGDTYGTTELQGVPYAQPTIITDVTNDMAVAQEEIFGPVVTVIPFEEYEEVIEKANDTHYGLAAGVWTNDLKTAHRAADDLEAGSIWVNTYSDMTDPGAPFGGYKDSGIGRELASETYKAYTQTKNVKISLASIPDPF